MNSVVTSKGVEFRDYVRKLLVSQDGRYSKELVFNLWERTIKKIIYTDFLTTARWKNLLLNTEDTCKPHINIRKTTWRACRPTCSSKDSGGDRISVSLADSRVLCFSFIKTTRTTRPQVVFLQCVSCYSRGVWEDLTASSTLGKPQSLLALLGLAVREADPCAEPSCGRCVAKLGRAKATRLDHSARQSSKGTANTDRRLTLGNVYRFCIWTEWVSSYIRAAVIASIFSKQNVIFMERYFTQTLETRGPQRTILFFK